MIVGLGVDLLDVERIEAERREHGVDFGRDVFTPKEIAYCESQRHPAQHYAARIAVKEAVFKALSLEGREGMRWREVELRAEPDGVRQVVLHGRIKELAEDRRVNRIHVSLSHTKALATASVILEA